MALLTTTIGAYPKPDYVPTPDWFREGGRVFQAQLKPTRNNGFGC